MSKHGRALIFLAGYTAIVAATTVAVEKTIGLAGVISPAIAKVVETINPTYDTDWSNSQKAGLTTGGTSNPRMANPKSAEVCSYPKHGGTLVRGTGKFIVESANDDGHGIVGWKPIPDRDTEHEFCVVIRVATGAKEDERHIVGHTAVLESFLKK